MSFVRVIAALGLALCMGCTERDFIVGEPTPPETGGDDDGTEGDDDNGGEGEGQNEEEGGTGDGTGDDTGDDTDTDTDTDDDDGVVVFEGDGRRHVMSGAARQHTHQMPRERREDRARQGETR